MSDTFNDPSQDPVSHETASRRPTIGARPAPGGSKPKSKLPLVAAVGLGLLVLALLAFFLLKDGGISGGKTVAKVGDASIKQDDFDYWLGVAAKSQSQSSGAAPVPDPPEFTKCVDQLSKVKPPQGQKAPSREQLKAQCKQQYENLKQQTMQFLVSSEWIRQEAKDRSIEITEEEVDKRFAEQKKQFAGKPGEYEKLLKQTGQTEEDLRTRVELDLLSNKLREVIVKDTGKSVSDAELKAYFEKNKNQFAQPQRRDLQVVVTKTAAKAQEAKSALAGGQSFATVAKKFSIDEASKAQGGKLLGVAKGQQEPALDKAVFAADQGKVVGPVKTQFGFFVFEVTKNYPSASASFEKSKEQVRAQVKAQEEQKALDSFVQKFRAKWQKETDCEKGYVIPDCANAPAAQQAPPATPQGAPQEQPQR